MKIYYVVYIKGEVVADCLNAILCLIKPEVKHPAHITVRGPYTQEINIEPFNKKARGIPLILDGVGRFANSKQYTVFLSCNAPSLESVWWKPDYSFVPHVTLYNETSRQEANEIFDIANRYDYDIFLTVKELEPLIIGGEPSSLRPVTFDEHNISLIAQEHISRESVTTLSRNRRHDAMDRILQFLSLVSAYPHDAELTWEEIFKRLI